MHDPVERYTSGRTHDGTAHVWINPSVVGNSFGGKLFLDDSLMCKYGAQGGQAGWAVAQVDETTHELVSSAHGAMPFSLPVQRRIMRAELWALLQALILSEPGATFISDCAGVLQGLTRGEKWCTTGQRPHADVWRRIWQRFRDIGKKAYADSVTKCEAHLSIAERAKLGDAGRLVAAGSEWADNLAKDGARDDSFRQCCVTGTRQQPILALTSSPTSETSSCAQRLERDGRTSPHRHKDGAKWTDAGNV